MTAVGVGDRVPQLIDDLPQVYLSRLRAKIGPEQGHQRFAPVWAGRLRNQIDKECLGLQGAERRKQIIVRISLECSEQSNTQLGHDALRMGVPLFKDVRKRASNWQNYIIPSGI